MAAAAAVHYTRAVATRTPETTTDYAAAWRERWESDRRRARGRRQEALDRLDDLVAILVERFDADAVVLFGSLARGDFGLESDIDLAVSGVPGARFFTAAAAVADAARPFRVDLLPWEDLTPAMRRVIDEEGRVLHGPR